LIVELPGVRDAQGLSPFWQGLGRHFYAGDPTEALARHGAAWRDLVAALLPRQLIYAAFLPEAAQQAVGGCLESAQPLRELLQGLGWAYRQHVGVDEGGAVMEWGSIT
jgi:arginine N-succinyltransferase